MKKNSKKIKLFIIIIGLTLFLGGCNFNKSKEKVPQISLETKNIVSNYIKENISELSSQKEVLGGKFYVTQIKFENPNIVIVNYEDGHIALQAQANFTLENNNPQINNFKLIKDENEIVITNEHLKCNNHNDCVPLPGCHPRECINKKYQNNYDQPEACTMMYDNCAAYKNDDCICQQGTCFNENLMDSECSQ